MEPSPSNGNGDNKESNEPDYDEEFEKQAEETGEISTSNKILEKFAIFASEYIYDSKKT